MVTWYVVYGQSLEFYPIYCHSWGTGSTVPFDTTNNFMNLILGRKDKKLRHQTSLCEVIIFEQYDFSTDMNADFLAMPFSKVYYKKKGLLLGLIIISL